MARHPVERYRRSTALDATRLDTLIVSALLILTGIGLASIWQRLGVRISRRFAESVAVVAIAAVTFVIAGCASMGLPGFSGFIAELQVIIGAWQAFPTLSVITGVGIVVGVAYTLRAMQKAFFGDEPLAPTISPSDEDKETTSHAGQQHAMDEVSVPERIGAAMLIGVSLLVGLYPRVLLDVIVPSFNSPLFEWVKKGGGQ